MLKTALLPYILHYMLNNLRGKPFGHARFMVDDLGDDQRGTGYDVLLWLEQEVVLHQYAVPEIIIHTANPAARQRMLASVDAIKKWRLK